MGAFSGARVIPPLLPLRTASIHALTQQDTQYSLRETGHCHSLFIHLMFVWGGHGHSYRFFPPPLITAISTLKCKCTQGQPPLLRDSGVPLSLADRFNRGWTHLSLSLSLRESGHCHSLFIHLIFTLFDVFTVWMSPKRRKLLGRLTAAASTARTARASETPEQTSLCLSWMALSSAACLSTESAAVRTERLASVASTMSARCTRLSVEERSLQNSQGAVRVARLRASQSPAQKTLRHLRDAIANACSSGLESPKQTTSHHHRNTRATVASRASEQPQETAHCRVINACSTASARALESLAQTTVRRVRNAHPTASARAAENSEGEPPQFLQIYFLADYNEQVDACLGILPTDFSVGRRRDILFHLQDMLHETNSYIQSLKFVLQNNSSPSFSVVIDADRPLHSEHERRFIAPACNEVATVIHGEKHNSRDIVIKYQSGGLRASVKPTVHRLSPVPLLFSIRKRWIPLQNPNIPGKQ
ncbi:unnamed protein product [Acanthosepion pharaonis]|uniref:Uncharacterized protein n=1 Tax=Acanthosepion pharaonis TaxID=158019 RepID=A0A812CY61_ACAPH|nr:unnamed protein product [Sepia pharaonis]